MFHANVVIVVLMFAPATDAEQVFRFEEVQNFVDCPRAPDQRQRVRGGCGVVEQVAPFERQIVRVETVGVGFCEDAIVFIVFNKVGNIQFTVMLLCHFRTIAPMIVCRIVICFE